MVTDFRVQGGKLVQTKSRHSVPRVKLFSGLILFDEIKILFECICHYLKDKVAMVKDDNLDKW